MAKTIDNVTNNDFWGRKGLVVYKINHNFAKKVRDI